MHNGSELMSKSSAKYHSRKFQCDWSEYVDGATSI